MSQCYCEDCQEIKYCHSSTIDLLKQENARLRAILDMANQYSCTCGCGIHEEARAALEEK